MKNCLKNKILIATYTVAFIVWVISVSSLDSQSYVPHIMTVISGAYLVLGGIANGLFD